MYIRYVGFKVGAHSRIYNFEVVEAAQEARQFAIKIQSEAFRPSALKFQDGPGICFKRLELELGAETLESRAKARLEVGDEEIREFVERNYSRKPSTRSVQERARLVHKASLRP